MVRLFVSSFQEPDTGRLTLANYRDAYLNIRHLEALGNSLVLGAGVAVMAALFGVPIAWAISRTDMPAKGFVRVMVLGAFITPPYLGAIGWILLAGPNRGPGWHFQHLFHGRSDPCRVNYVFSLRFRFHEFGA
jgi:iron(III) transport system permease protein